MMADSDQLHPKAGMKQAGWRPLLKDDVQVLHHSTCDRELIFKEVLCRCDEGSGDEIVLDHPSGPRFQHHVSLGGKTESRGGRYVKTEGGDWSAAAQTQESLTPSPTQATKGKGLNLPQSLRKLHAPGPSLSLDFWPLERLENPFMLLKAI